MDMNILSQISYLPVAVSSIAFFVLGAVWFSPLLLSIHWVQELARHNVIIQQPTSNVLWTKMLLTFAANIIASIAMACLVVMTNSTTFSSGLMLGIIAALGFAATAVASVFIWESRSLKLFLIDTGYPVVGIIAAGIILSVWR